MILREKVEELAAYCLILDKEGKPEKVQERHWWFKEIINSPEGMKLLEWVAREAVKNCDRWEVPDSQESDADIYQRTDFNPFWWAKFIEKEK